MSRKSAKVWSHSELCDKAVHWLKRSPSAGGAGCHVALSEAPSGFTGEIPDAIGFRCAGSAEDGYVVIEIKTSHIAVATHWDWACFDIISARRI